MKILCNHTILSAEDSENLSVNAAIGDEEYENEDIEDTVDDLSVAVDDFSEMIEDVDEDDTTIEIDNNIADRYIAECDVCYGVFISAMSETDLQVEYLSGVCPLCEKESNQYLKWVVKEA